MKKLCILLSFLLCFSFLPVYANEEFEGEFDYYFDVEDESILYEEYVDSIFHSGVYEYSAYSIAPSFSLEAYYDVYNSLYSSICDVASGTLSSSKFSLSNRIVFPYEMSHVTEESSSSELLNASISCTKAMLNEILDVLRINCPYELYWYDKTQGTNASFSYSFEEGSLVVYNYSFSMFVSSSYSVDGLKGSTSVDLSKTGMALRAYQNALKWLDEASCLSDIDKLYYFKDKICEMTSYNEKAAADSRNVGGYGNPWQMIYVFDEDPTTSVVCEGYAKAFQFLCDMSNMSCFLIEGSMDSVGHMWNIVSIDSNNYLVDVTNCDTGKVGDGNRLFLVGMDGDVNDYYKELDSVVHYSYDPSMFSIYGDILCLSSFDYISDGMIEYIVDDFVIQSVYSNQFDMAESFYSGPVPYVVDHTELIDSVYKVYLKVEDAFYSGSSMLIDDQIHYSFFVFLPDGDFELSCDDTPLRKGNMSIHGQEFILDLNPKELSDDFSIYLNDSLLTICKPYEYLNRLIDEFDSLKAKQLSTYAYYAQYYFNYHTDTVNVRCFDMPSFNPSFLSLGPNFVGERLVLQSRLSLELYFNKDVTIYVDGIKESCKKVDQYFVVSISGNKHHFIEVDGIRYPYSILSYASKAQRSNNNYLDLLCQAIVSFYQ